MDKLTKEIKALKGDMVSQGDLRAVRALAYSSKKVVDKELATKKLLQGEPQGGSCGDDLKVAEGEGFTNLVVCNKGSLGRYVGNYVLEEEVIEVDGFVEDTTKVVRYGVRDVSDPRESEFIVFSKWIYFWLILIDGRIQEIRNIWAYVEDGALWFRRWLCLNCM